jgi:hypothetical protein
VAAEVLQGVDMNSAAIAVMSSRCSASSNPNAMTRSELGDPAETSVDSAS